MSLLDTTPMHYLSATPSHFNTQPLVSGTHLDLMLAQSITRCQFLPCYHLQVWMQGKRSLQLLNFPLHYAVTSNITVLRVVVCRNTRTKVIKLWYMYSHVVVIHNCMQNTLHSMWYTVIWAQPAGQNSSFPALISLCQEYSYNSQCGRLAGGRVP